MIATDQMIDTMEWVEVVDTDQMIVIDMEEEAAVVVCIHHHDDIRQDIHHLDIQWTIALVVVIWADVIILKIDIQTQDQIVIPNLMADIIQWL